MRQQPSSSQGASQGFLARFRSRANTRQDRLIARRQSQMSMRAAMKRIRTRIALTSPSGPNTGRNSITFFGDAIDEYASVASAEEGEDAAKPVTIATPTGQGITSGGVGAL